MKWNSPQTLIALMAMAFLLGTLFPVGTWLRDHLASAPVAAQGRGPINPPAPEPIVPEVEAEVGPLVYSQESGQSSSSGDFLAVTGSYGVGTSVLYVIDSVTRRLVVYEARGGSPAMRSVVFVGARNIDLDLQLEQYNDDSEYTYRRLQSMFEQKRERETRRADQNQGSDGR
ncbi:MAG: hypothetical protein VYE77_12825 [Planctomycetota bacterium]|nr:hypothetical protein [Planctomycetota bacterium]